MAIDTSSASPLSPSGSRLTGRDEELCVADVVDFTLSGDPRGGVAWDCFGQVDNVFCFKTRRETFWTGDVCKISEWVEGKSVSLENANVSQQVFL